MNINDRISTEPKTLAIEILKKIADCVYDNGRDLHRAHHTDKIELNSNGLQHVVRELGEFLSGDLQSAEINLMRDERFIDQIFSGYDCELYGHSPEEFWGETERAIK